MVLRFVKLFAFSVGIVFALGFWFYQTRQIEPVVLSPSELDSVQDKLDSILKTGSVLGKRSYSFSEREVNGLLNHSTTYANQVKFDFVEDTVVVHARLTIPKESGFMGGMKVRIRGELEFSLKNGVPYLTAKNLSSFGIPIPLEYFQEHLNRNLYADLIQTLDEDYSLPKVEDIKIQPGEIEFNFQ